MKKLYSFSIPDLPPSLNKIYIGYEYGIRKRHELVDVFYKVAQYTLPHIRETIGHPVGVFLSFTMKGKKIFDTSDTDNRLKVMFDMFQYFGIVKNDCLIYFHSVEKLTGPKDNSAGFFFSLDDPDFLKIQKIIGN
jgi:hypothetical protein